MGCGLFNDLGTIQKNYRVKEKGKTMEKQMKAIIFAEKQAEFYCVKGSKQWQGWINNAKKIRQEIGEDREWWKLQSILKAS